MPLDVRFTERRGHATELAHEACADYDVIIGAGGDGTINEVLNGMMGSAAEDGHHPLGHRQRLCPGNEFPQDAQGRVQDDPQGARASSSTPPSATAGTSS